MGYFTSLSILVFAVGGCEKISPYVNKVKDPSKRFSKGNYLYGGHGGRMCDPWNNRHGNDV